MLVLGLGFVLKESLRTFFGLCLWPLRSSTLALALKVKSLTLTLALKVRSLLTLLPKFSNLSIPRTFLVRVQIYPTPCQ